MAFLTKTKANEILFLWKVGAELFPPHIINSALVATGDLDGASGKRGAGVVRVPSQTVRMEGAGVVVGERFSNSVPIRVWRSTATADSSDEGASK